MDRTVMECLSEEKYLGGKKKPEKLKETGCDKNRAFLAETVPSVKAVSQEQLGLFQEQNSKQGSKYRVNSQKQTSSKVKECVYWGKKGSPFSKRNQRWYCYLIFVCRRLCWLQVKENRL